MKAAFLLNFARFVEWPAAAFAVAADPLVLCIFGKDPFGDTLDQIVSRKTINARRLAIRRISDPGAVRSCHVLFIAASQARRFGEIADTVAGSSVLAVGESEGFAERGGMINFVVEDNRVRFEINPSTAARSRLRISSKLLQLATIVGGPAQEK